MHLIAASAWLGGLLPLALLLTAARREGISLALAREATLRFSTLGLISVGVLIATGSVNGWILTGSVPALVGTDYGRLLLANKRPADAEKVFRTDLDRNPRDARALAGLRDALQAQNRQYESDQIDRQFRAAWKIASDRRRAIVQP